MRVLDLFEMLNSAGFVLQVRSERYPYVRGSCMLELFMVNSGFLVSEVSHNLPNVRA